MLGKAGKAMAWGVLAAALGLVCSGMAPAARAEAQARFLGSEACKECHEEQYGRFMKYSKKAHSFKSVQALKKGLTQAELGKCYECHTTGYNQPGGFRSEAETPGLKDAGCEVCHGPGSLHQESQDPKDIRRKLTAKQCESCHNAERVGAFRFRPLVQGGAH